MLHFSNWILFIKAARLDTINIASLIMLYCIVIHSITYSLLVPSYISITTYPNAYIYMHTLHIHTLSYSNIWSSVNHVVPSPSVSVTALDDNPIIGKPYSMECNVIVAKGIIGNVVITWITNDTEKSRVNYTAWGNNSEYVDIYNTSRLHFNDTNTTYSCEVVITGTHAVVNSSSAITIDNITVGR